MVEAIANDVLDKLNLSPLSKDLEDLVGMDTHIAAMSELLHLESKDVKMVGIWGSSGIGKTTIGRVLYNRLSRQFQGSVFIDRGFISQSMEIYKTANQDDYNMKLHLLRRFLSEILDKKDIMIGCLGAAEERLKHHKVLICIDDVDDQAVLDTLVNQTQWFGSGSRIIVITKDKQFLRAHGIDLIYEVCLPSAELALEMFCRSAFRQNFPPYGLIELASEVARCAGNLPLGLKVLGSYLRGRDKEDLIDMLPRLRNGLNGKFEKTLRICYEGLDNKKDKGIFRHIACLFNGEKVEDIKLLLAESGLDVNIGLKNLVDKSLVHVRKGIVEMHSLLQEMGKEIVREQSNEPGEREFLMDSEDICGVLEDNTGTKKVLGISLNIDKIDELRIHKNAFKGMHNLLFLKIHTKETNQLTRRKWDQETRVKWYLPEDFDYLPNKLRLLRLDTYPRGFMPSKFCPENLVKFVLQESKLERLWEGVQTLRGLKEIDLTKSIHLKEIPDLSMATNLEKLDLCDCSSLVELPYSIRYLNKLEVLNMWGCSSLEILPNGINLQSLNRFCFGGCLRLNIFPDISTNISELCFSETCIDELPSNIRLQNLVHGTMRAMKSEKFWKRGQPLTPIMAMLPHTLEQLFLSDNPTLVELPCSIQSFTKLHGLGITDCPNLETLPTGINFQYLNFLALSGCSRLKTFPDISTNIVTLHLLRTGIEEVPWWIDKFTKLIRISMNGCNNLVRVSLNIYNLKSLTADFSNCRSLTEASWNGSPSQVAMAREKIHSKFSVLKEDLFHFDFLNLDPEAILNSRSIIWNSMTLSGEDIPLYFTHQTAETSFTNIPLLHTSLSQNVFRFKACAMVIFDYWPFPRNYSYGVCIRVHCRFKDKFGNSFDTFGQPLFFQTNDKGNRLFTLDCRVPLNKDNAPFAQENYDHVDLQLHFVMDNSDYISFHKFKGWGIRLLEECSLPENRLSEECVETVMKRHRDNGSNSKLHEGPLKKPMLCPASDTEEDEQRMSI